MAPSTNLQDAALHQAAQNIIALNDKARLQTLLFQDQIYWVKRLDRPRFYGLGKLIHWLLSPIAVAPILKSSPLRSAQQRALDEYAKAEALRRAGIATPPMAIIAPTVVISQDKGETLNDKVLHLISIKDHAGVDALLKRVTIALGHLHAKGFVHGRPHLRDMFEEATGAIGFFDFEEVPEKSMPFADAAARDLLLLSFQISQFSTNAQSGYDALEAWRIIAPEAACHRVTHHVRKLKHFATLVTKMGGKKAGRDLREFLAAYDLLADTIQQAPDRWQA